MNRTHLLPRVRYRVAKLDRIGFGLLNLLPLTGPHYANLEDAAAAVAGDLKSAESWDSLRATDTVYGLSETREQWDAQAAWLEPRAQAIIDIARQHEVTSIASYGVGACLVEHEIAKLAPDLHLIVSDFSPKTVWRLQTLFPEADVRHFDLAHHTPFEADLTLLHRVDSEFTNRQWRRILRRLNGKLVLFIPGEIRSARELVEMLRRRYRHPEQVVRAGRSRTRPTFRRLLGRRATHVHLADVEGWIR